LRNKQCTERLIYCLSYHYQAIQCAPTTRHADFFKHISLQVIRLLQCTPEQESKLLESKPTDMWCQLIKG